jgi:hypothetical protein
LAGGDPQAFDLTGDRAAAFEALRFELCVVGFLFSNR